MGLITNKYFWIVAGVIALILSIVFTVQHIRIKSANAEIEKLQSKCAELEEALAESEQENIHLRDMMELANKALETAVEKLEKGKHEYDERNQQIDNADDDWLMCPLPDDVRNAFADYC